MHVLLILLIIAALIIVGGLLVELVFTVLSCLIMLPVLIYAMFKNRNQIK